MLPQNVDINKLSANVIWGYLIEIGTNPILRLVSDNEDWNWNNQLWQAFPFEISSMHSSGGGEIQQMTIKISNVTTTILKAIDSLNGQLNIPVTVRVARKDESSPDALYSLQLESVSYDEQWVNLVLGAKVSYTRSFPVYTYGKACQWVYKGWQCKYAGSLNSCNKTWKDCQAHNNIDRFGGIRGDD